MILVTIQQTSSKEVCEILITGHAGFADNGYDIVCAAVSSQIISLENSLVQLVQVPVETQVNEVDGGYLKLMLPTGLTSKIQHDVQLLVQHFMLAMQVTQAAYPEFIEIQFEIV